MVPDDCSGAEPQAPATLPQPPADVHIIARHTELRIKAAHGLEAGFSKRHVAAWNMFRLRIRKEHVSGPARGARDRAGNRPIIWKRNVRTTDAHVVRIHEDGGQMRQPIGVGARVVVGISNNFARGGFQARIARGAQAPVRSADHPHAVFAGHGGRSILGAIVNYNDLEVRVAQFGETVQAVAQCAFPVESAHQYGNARPSLVRRKRSFSKGSLDRVQSGLGSSCPVG